VGNELEVYGFTRADNVIQATRIQRKAPGDLTEWKLTGFVTASSPADFNVGTQVVSLSIVDATGCGAAVPAPERFVEVKAFRDDTVLNPIVASNVQCKRGGLLGELDDSVTLRRIQGFVSAFTADGFIVGGEALEGQSVRLTSTTTVRNGSLDEDLFIGVKVEVTGSFNSTTGMLTATRVSFREARVRVRAPAAVLGGTLTVLELPVQGGLLDARGQEDLAKVGNGDNIRLKGFVDKDKTIFATEIDRRSEPEPLRLRGPVDKNSIDAAARTFSVLDVAIIGGNAYKDSRDSTTTTITADQFFSILTDGQPVQVEGGSFSPGPSITGPEEIELED
jgi:hypothetical protein